jgi:hypothetical protein
MTQKSLIKMQILPIKNQILKNRLGTYLIGPKRRFWKKNFFGYISKKIWFRVCSVTAEMFEHRNSGKNRRKRSEIFSKIYEGHIRIWFRSKKNSKLSHACVPLRRWKRLYALLVVSVHLQREKYCKPNSSSLRFEWYYFRPRLCSIDSTFMEDIQ